MKTFLFLASLALISDQVLCKYIASNEGNSFMRPINANINDKEVCGFCVGAFTHFKDVLCTYQSQLKLALKNFCKITGGFSVECGKLVDEYYDPAFNRFVKNFNATSFCTMITLCPGEYHFPSLKSSGTCFVCKEIIALVKIELQSDYLKKRVRSELENICNETGSFAEECRTIVDSKFEMLYKILPEALDGVCTDLNLCTSSIQNHSPKTHSQESCFVCKEVVATIKTVFNSPSIRNKMKKELEKFCNNAGSYAKECTALVDQNFNTAYTRFLMAMDEICGQLNLCSSKSKLKISKKVKISEPCIVCEQVIGTIKYMLTDSTAKKFIQRELEGLCDEVVGFEKYCKLGVDFLFDRVYDKLVKLLDPYTLCEELRACKRKEVRSKNPNNELCTVCQEAVKDAKVELQNPKIKEELKAEILKMCSKFKSFSTRCEAYINGYYDFAYDMFVDYLNPVETCEDIGLCPHSKSRNVTTVEKKKTNANELCNVCVSGISKLHKWMLKPEIKPEAKELALLLCLELDSYSNKCQSYVNSYFDILYVLIAGSLDPQLCKEVDLCSTEDVSNRIPQKKSTDSVYCGPCVEGIKEYSAILYKPATKAEIKSDLKSVCSMMKYLEKECDTLVDDNYDKLYTMLLNYLKSPKKVCRDVGLCDNGKTLKKSDEICTLCKDFFKLIVKHLNDTKFEAQLKAKAKALCSGIHQSLIAEMCLNGVNSYFDELYDKLKTYMNPLTICTDLDLCTSYTPADMVKHVQLSENRIVPFTSRKSGNSVEVRDDTGCVICKVATTLLANEIVRLEVKGKAMAVYEMESLCKNLPHDINKQCLDFVSIYGPPVVQMVIAEYGNPKDICYELKIC